MAERNLLLTLCFDGRTYSGWQVQPHSPTIMEALQDAMEKSIGERPDVKGCSRTDAGVSALRYAVSFRTSCAIPAERVPMAINSRLPAEISVLSCREVHKDFHARFYCAGKRYCYRIWNNRIRDPFRNGLTHVYVGALDVERMHRAAQTLVGTHDFKAFSNYNKKEIEDTVRTLTECTVTRNGDEIEIRVTGDGFLYNMVRIVAGTLLQIGWGGRKEEELCAVLASCDRARAGLTLPAEGLILEEVFYLPNDQKPQKLRGEAKDESLLDEMPCTARHWE